MTEQAADLNSRALARAHALAEQWQGDQTTINRAEASTLLMEVIQLHGWTQTTVEPAPDLNLVWDAARTASGQQPEHTCPDGQPCPSHDEPAAAVGQCGKWGGCVLDASHTGPHRHTPRPAVGQPAEAQPADPWTPANLHFLRFALGCAAAVMYSEDDFTDEDHAALDQLRAFAGPEPYEQAAETRAAAQTVEDE